VKDAASYQRKIMDESNALAHTTLAKKFAFPVSSRWGRATNLFRPTLTGGS
jgi:hypothetical protein